MRKFYIIFVLVILFQGEALSVEGESVLITRRPSKARPELDAKVLKGYRDGMPFRDWVFSNEYIEMEMPAVDGWYSTFSKSKESYALSLKGRKNKSRLSFTLFEDDELLKDNSSKSLNSYVDLLKREFPGRIEVLNEKERYRVKNTFFIIGVTYRVVDFLVKAPSGDMKRVRDYIVFPKNEKYKLLVIRFEVSHGKESKLLHQLNESLRHSILKEIEEEG